MSLYPKSPSVLSGRSQDTLTLPKLSSTHTAERPLRGGTTGRGVVGAERLSKACRVRPVVRTK